MFNLNKEEFTAKYKKNIPQILTQEIIADTETPVSTLLKVSKNEKYSFLLESVEGGEQRGRYSLLGCNPDIIWKVDSGKIEIKSFDFEINNKLINQNDPILSLKELLEYSKIENNNKETPYPVLVGYLGYPMIKYMEKIKLKNIDSINIPEAIMIRPKVVAVFDNIKDIISIMSAVYPNKRITAEDAYNNAKKRISDFIGKINSGYIKDNMFNNINKNNKIKFKSNYSKEEYFTIIDKAKKYIRKGDIFQVVTSQRFISDYKLNAKHLYRSLRRLNPSPFLVNLIPPEF